MQRMSLEPGLQPSELELEEENRKARIAVLQNVAAFGAIVVLLRIGEFMHLIRDESIMLFSPPIMLLSNSQEMYQLY